MKLTPELMQQFKYELARREFFYYCHLQAPDFYRKDRDYLVELCNTLQEFYEDPDAKVLIMNMPPRHGKSRTAQMAAKWILGKNPVEKIMTGSYNATLSSTFAKNVRNDIQEVKADENRVVYTDIFPNVRIKRGDASMDMWSLEGGYNSYLATSPSGTATGFGASILIIDDIIKNAEEAYNENTKAKHWDWFTNTMLSRLEEGGKIIIIMTRWASDDLAGRAIEHFGDKAKVITMKALQDNGTMLCDDILSYESYIEKFRAMGEDIASANYQQEPIDVKGRLYTYFSTYKDIPRDDKGYPLFSAVKAYVDSADTGEDWLCAIVYGVYNDNAYILDILFTDAPMEVTERKTAELLHRNGVNVSDIESNNGGRGFARNVKRILKEKYPGNRTKIVTFHQSKNKEARILSNSTQVMDHVLYPENFKELWPEYYSAMYKYQRKGKNAHDDAPDATTGVVERLNAPVIKSINSDIY
ncbi:MAG: phage terminase large subunit [Streptococcus sp.]|uniref:phage terminase large subunit n=1 Tax=Streptococcus sp. TaxID=1306 RepID=UPI0025E08D5D|nr:phage terminase large subunit [Streptococcus sp.]MBS6245480.1 phage terminase large subunit [Streptococcus sp.]